MLKLTKKADYGLIAMRHLAGSSGRGASAKDIADAYQVPLPLLSKVLQRLERKRHLIGVGDVFGRFRSCRKSSNDWPRADC